MRFFALSQPVIQLVPLNVEAGIAVRRTTADSNHGQAKHRAFLRCSPIELHLQFYWFPEILLSHGVTIHIRMAEHLPTQQRGASPLVVNWTRRQVGTLHVAQRIWVPLH